MQFSFKKTDLVFPHLSSLCLHCTLTPRLGQVLYTLQKSQNDGRENINRIWAGFTQLFWLKWSSELVCVYNASL